MGGYAKFFLRLKSASDGLPILPGQARQAMNCPLPLALALPHHITDGRRELHAWTPATPTAHRTRCPLTTPTMRCASLALPNGCAALGLAPPTPPACRCAAIKELLDASAAADSPPVLPMSPRRTALLLFRRERQLLARLSPPGCSPSAVDDARARTGGLATLTPRRAARMRVGFSGSTPRPNSHRSSR